MLYQKKNWTSLPQIFHKILNANEFRETHSSKVLLTSLFSIARTDGKFDFGPDFGAIHDASRMRHVAFP